MKTERQTKILALIAIVIAIGGLSIGFAAFSTTLNINGAAQVEASSWEIIFENLSAETVTGTATELAAPTIATGSTTISGFDASLTTPGDTIVYNFDVTNNGTFDAEIGTLTVAAPTCTGTGATATTDAANVCGNLTYTLTYTDGTAVAVNDTLDAGQTRGMKITLTYAADTTAAELPAALVEVTTLDASIIYNQA